MEADFSGCSSHTGKEGSANCESNYPLLPNPRAPKKTCPLTEFKTCHHLRIKPSRVSMSRGLVTEITMAGMRRQISFRHYLSFVHPNNLKGKVVSLYGLTKRLEYIGAATDYTDARLRRPPLIRHFTHDNFNIYKELPVDILSGKMFSKRSPARLHVQPHRPGCASAFQDLRCPDQ